MRSLLVVYNGDQVDQSGYQLIVILPCVLSFFTFIFERCFIKILIVIRFEDILVWALYTHMPLRSVILSPLYAAFPSAQPYPQVSIRVRITYILQITTINPTS